MFVLRHQVAVKLTDFDVYNLPRDVQDTSSIRRSGHYVTTKRRYTALAWRVYMWVHIAAGECTRHDNSVPAVALYKRVRINTAEPANTVRQVPHKLWVLIPVGIEARCDARNVVTRPITYAVV
jgi:hypothetical protein